MDKTAILGQLHQLTGNLRPAPGTSVDELSTLQRNLAEQIVADPGFTVSGNRLQHSAAQSELAVNFAERFSHLSDLWTNTPAHQNSATPLVFRRETSFSSPLLGNSVPIWGSGMAPSKTFGPFLDENEIKVWFDFYFPTRLVQVLLQGSSTPVLLVPMWGLLTGRKSYRIEPGSAWIASGLIARTPLLDGYYTGLKIKGGSIDLTQLATIDSDRIVVPASATVALHLDLDQNSITATAVDAGMDAKDAVVKLPTTLDVKFTALGSSINPANASCTGGRA
jgi:hypothetical protein